MGTPVYTVIVIDKVSSPGLTRYQDLTAIAGADCSKSVFNPTTAPKPAPSKLVLSFPMDTPDLSIREMMQVWAGWRDPDSGAWKDLPTPVFGGYITKLRERTWGNEKVFECDLADYGILLTRTRTLGWPVQLPDNPPEVGFPPDYTPRDWLIGQTSEGQPYDGFLRTYLGNGVRFGGVDPIFDQISLPADCWPGTSSTLGQFGPSTLDKMIQALADVTLYAYYKHTSGGPDLTVGYWMSAVADGDKIVPLFNFRNVADVALTPKWTIRAPRLGDPDPDPDTTGLATEGWAVQDWWAERDAQDVMTTIMVLGVGGDPTVPPDADGNAPLVYADFQDADHAAAYPTDYQLGPNPGWSGDPITETRLHTLELATFLAGTLESRLWGAKGSYEFYTFLPVQAGDRVRLIDENEALDRVFVAVSSEQEWNEGHPRWHVRVGFTEPTLQDIMKGGLPDVLLTAQELNFQLGTLQQRTLPGEPPQIPLERTPTHPERNKTTPRFTDTPAQIWQASTQLRRDDQGDPIPHSDLNPPAFVARAQGPDKEVRGGFGPQGEPRGHGFTIAKGIWAAPIELPIWQTITFVRVVEIGAATGWTFAVNDTPAALPFTVHDGDTLQLTPPSPSVACGVALVEFASLPPMVGN